jgi:hypothetical protein
LAVLVFVKSAFLAELEQKPNDVDVDELREAVSLGDRRQGRVKWPANC